MSDDFGVGPPPEFPPLEIDVRSPGERFLDSGRDVVGRVSTLVETQRFDAAAVAWLCFILAITGAQIYRAMFLSSFDAIPTSEKLWTKLQLLTQSGGTILIFGCMIGIVLALLQPGRLANLALWLCTLGGVWATATGCIGVVVAFHDPSHGSGINFSGGTGFADQAVQGVLFFGFAGMGLVLTTIAWRIAIAPGGQAPAREARADDPVELS